jgi:hypothetical protein
MSEIQRPAIHMNDRNWIEAQKYIGKQLMKQGIETAILPGGLAVDARAWRGFKHSVNVKVFVMAEPEKLLVDADPRCAYCWRPRDDPKHSTEGLVRTGKLIPVEFDRVDPNAEGVENVYQYAGATYEQNGEVKEVTGFVACGDYQLFEVPPKVAYEWFQEPVDRTFSDLAGLKPKFRATAEEFYNRQGEDFQDADIRITQRQDVSTEKRHPITH